MLSLIEALLKYSNKHSSSIIAALLGIIIVGGIGGGFWIQNLNSVIAERNKLEEQRLALAEERQSTAIASAHLQYRGINQEVISIIDKLELSAKESTSKLEDWRRDLEIAANFRGLSPSVKDQLLSISQSLNDQSATNSKEFADAKASVRAALSIPPANEVERHYWRSPGLALLPFLLLALASSLAVAAFLRQRDKRRRARVHLKNACDLLLEKSVRPRDLQRFEQAVLRNELKSALDELEALGRRLEDPGQVRFDWLSFWRELTEAADKIGARGRARRYRSRGKYGAASYDADSPEL